MNAIRHSYAGHWSDRPEVDTRVSLAEQEDRQIPVGAPSFWMLVLWAISPFLAIGLGSSIAALLRI